MDSGWEGALYPYVRMPVHYIGEAYVHAVWWICTHIPVRPFAAITQTHPVAIHAFNSLNL